MLTSRRLGKLFLRIGRPALLLDYIIECVESTTVDLRGRRMLESENQECKHCSNKFFGNLVLWASRPGNMTRFARVTSFLSFFLMFAYGESALVVRALAWYLVLPYLAVCLLGHTGSRQQQTIPRVPFGPSWAEG